jgi:hypothetical protein
MGVVIMIVYFSEGRKFRSDLSGVPDMIPLLLFIAAFAVKKYNPDILVADHLL